jgi:hypothetical protein
MGRITYTSGIDLYTRILSYILNLILWAFLAISITTLLDFIIAHSISEWVGMVVGATLFIILYIYFLESFYNAVSAYLYIRIMLLTNVSFKEARYLSSLFVPSGNGAWYPMKHIRKLPREIRKPYLLKFASEVAASKEKEPLDIGLSRIGNDVITLGLSGNSQENKSERL